MVKSGSSPTVGSRGAASSKVGSGLQQVSSKPCFVKMPKKPSLMEIGVKPCYVKMPASLPPKLRRCFVTLNKVVVANANQSFTGSEKQLLLPKRARGGRKKGTPATKLTKAGKPQRRRSTIASLLAAGRGGKLPTREQLTTGRVSPDSGIDSRSQTPDEELEEEEGGVSDGEDVLQPDQEQIHADFLESLESDDEDEGLGSEQSNAGSEQSNAGSENSNAGIKPPTKGDQSNVLSRPSKGNSSSGGSDPFFHSMAAMFSSLPKSDYELDREKRIQEKNLLMAALKAEMDGFKAEVLPKPLALPKPRKPVGTPRMRRVASVGEVRHSGRVRKEKVSYSGLVDDFRESSLRIRRSLNPDDEGYHVYRQKQKVVGWTGRSHIDPNLNVLQPEDITQDMIDRIAVSSKKVYDQVLGSSCHQCRQKTVDTKTICRSGQCSGVRGQFCGVCLYNRYGESVAAALRDPTWRCPVCRGCCNCSFCLERPTGILHPTALRLGFASVHHYLEHLKLKHLQSYSA